MRIRILAFGFALAALTTIRVHAQPAVSFWDSLPRLTAPLGLAPENQLQLKGPVMAYVTRDSLILEKLEVVYPLALCSHPQTIRSRIFAGGLEGPAGAAPPPFALLEGSGTDRSSGEQVQAAVAYVRGGRLNRLEISRPANSASLQVRKESTDLENRKSGDEVLSIAGGKDAGIGRDSSLLVTGSDGWLEWVRWSKAGFGPQHSLPDAPTDLVRFGAGSFSGKDGKMYRLGPDTVPVAFAQPASSPADIVNADGALWDAGGVLLNDGGTWTYQNIPSGTYSDFRQVRTKDGLFVHLFGSGAAAISRFIRNQPSQIRTARLGGLSLPPQIASSTAFRPGPVPETLAVVLGDPEGNFEAPLLERQREGEFLRLVGELVAVDPQAGCVSPGLCLDPGSPEARLVLGRDSVNVTLALQVTSAYSSPCGPRQLYTRDTLVRRTHAWAYGDTLRVKAGTAQILVHYEHPSSIHGRAAVPRAAQVHSVDRKLGLPAWPAEGTAGSGAQAEIFGLDGSRLGAFGARESLSALAPGRVWVRWPGPSGTLSITQVTLR